MYADVVVEVHTESNEKRARHKLSCSFLMIKVQCEVLEVEIENKVVKLSIDNKNLFSAQIEVTTNCNWRCRHCYLPAYDNYGMTRENISDIFAQLRKMGTFEITLTGGEIFTRSDILDIISEARELGFRVILLTNISLLNEDIIKKLQELYIAKISCTVFSLNEEIHDFIVQKKVR